MQVLHYLPAGRCQWARLLAYGRQNRARAASCRAWCRWQDFALMRSRAAIRGNILARCVLRRLAVARSCSDAFSDALPWQFFRSMHSRRGPGREKRPSLATYRRRASKTSWRWQDMRAMHPKSPANRRWRIHHAQILPGRGPFRCADPSNHAWDTNLAREPPLHEPSNHAYRADLAIRRRRTARAIASTAPPLWRGSLPRDGRTGRGRLLVGRGGALLKECVALWGHRALTEKPASAKRRLRIPGTSNFAESREPAFAGRVQGGAAARRRLSNGPAE